MKTNTSFQFLLTLLLFSVASILPPRLIAQGTAFTYQGQLNDGGSPANGSYDLEFKIYTMPTGGTLADRTLDELAHYCQQRLVHRNA